MKENTFEEIIKCFPISEEDKDNKKRTNNRDV